VDVSLTTLYPTSTIAGTWTPTPSTPDHHTVVDESAIDETDYLFVDGFSTGLIEELGFGTVPATVDRITQLRVHIRTKGQDISHSPALRAEILLNGVFVGGFEADLDTNNVWKTIQATFTGLNILGSTWNAASTRSIRITPLNGSLSGFGGGFDFIEE